MNALRAVLLAILAVCGSFAVVPTAGAPTASPATAPSQQSDDVRTQQSDAVQSLQSQNATNQSLGAEISSFMQASSSQAEGTVSTGMWIARFNQTQNRSARKTLVEKRVNDLQKRLDALEQQKQTLVEAHENGQVSDLEYRARMSGVIGQLQSIRHAVNETKPRAKTVGTKVRAVQRIGERANAVGGSEVAEVARSINSVHVPNENVPNATNGTVGIGNGTGNASSNENGGNGGNASGSGNGNDAGTEQGTTSNDSAALASPVAAVETASRP